VEINIKVFFIHYVMMSFNMLSCSKRLIKGVFSKIKQYTLRRKGSIYSRTLKGSKALRIWNP